MLDLSLSTLSIGLAVFTALWMTVVAGYVFLAHARKHEELEELVDYGASTSFRQVFRYYRSMMFWLAWFLILFSLSVLLLEMAGYSSLFAQGWVGPFGVLVFAVDLALRGALFDIMEHFKLSITTIEMNRQSWWFVAYCFVFRMFYSLALMRILMSFAWIYGKMRVIRLGRGPVT